MWRSLVSALFAVFFAGCNDGVNCPWDRPSCCDNALFGCGPFDIPQGCSCGDYFSRSFQGFPLEQKATGRISTPNSVEGTWRATLQKNGKGCSYLSQSITTTLLIRETKQQVNVKALGLVTLRGNRAGKSVKPKGQMKVPFPRCIAEVSSDMNFASATTGMVSGNIKVTCQKQSLSCSASYAGLLRKM